MSLSSEKHFEEFFCAVHGHKPFPWQRRLADRACKGDWPHVIALPTAAGKTACIDIALFALACQWWKAPRRIFFIVDRRIVVDQAKMHADKLARAIHEARTGILKDVGDSLREIAQDDRPLDVYALRGGMYRETAWTRSPLQPLIVTSTVDQIGSQILFRGYGVSDSMKPVHAGLIGNDSILFLDEAHCARPFDQTIRSVEHYRRWNVSPVLFKFVSITATPHGDLPEEQIFRSDDSDHRDPVLGKRLFASKPADMVVVENTDSDNTSALVRELSKQARRLAKQGHKGVGIIVNRVKTARELKAELGDEAVLLTGRMRPLDRDRLFDEKLKSLLVNAEIGFVPTFVVGTQCLECGTDFDFPALVSECASLDALRQRFGRLNRVANRPTAAAVIVASSDQIAKDREDPIYGMSLTNTWKWLVAHQDGKKEGLPFVDFGVLSVERKWNETSAEDRSAVMAPSSNAPTLLPAHLDCWIQTTPRPSPEPGVGAFLHGHEKPGQPDVRVVFRQDIRSDWPEEEINKMWRQLCPFSADSVSLQDKTEEVWRSIVALRLPSSSESVPVPIGAFRKWLSGAPVEDNSGDIEGENGSSDTEEPIVRQALCWRGVHNNWLVTDAGEITPHDLYVVPCSTGGVETLGDFPFGVVDIADEAFQRSRDRVVLYLPESTTEGHDFFFDDNLTEEIRVKIATDHPDWSRQVVSSLLDARTRTVDEHPLGGFVITGKRLHRFDPSYSDDSEPSESFYLCSKRAIMLHTHSYGVAEYAHRFAKGCGLDASLYYLAGLWHDLGKLDPRFQAMLRQLSPRTAMGIPLAKSARFPRTKAERNEAREVHRYPVGARHELLSAALLSTKTDDDLLLHLIATHHGSARPFAEPVTENDAVEKPFKTRELFGQTFELPTSAQQIVDWNAELPERFWRVVRKFGWWGSAYREAVFRLADHAQSRAEQEKQEKETRSNTVKAPPFAYLEGKKHLHPLPLTGLDGANPLAFLAAIGTLVVVDGLSRSEKSPAWLTGRVGLSWGTAASAYTPVLHLADAPPSPAAFIYFLAEQLARTMEDHYAKWIVEMLTNEEQELAAQIRAQCRNRCSFERPYLDWVTALACESVPDGASQLQTVRRDYMVGNLRSIMQRTTAEHLRRSLLGPWDYADGLDNQSLHWEPSEDRRHAYQWHMPSGDPTRKRRGGMLGANRLALEAWPLFPSFPAGARVATRGFKGTGAFNTFWTWPLWRPPLTRDAIASMLGLPALCDEECDPRMFRNFGVLAVFRLQRILVGKTPNFTSSRAIA